MMLAQGAGLFDIALVLAYLAIIAYLGWLGYRHTRSTADYLVAGRKVHPFIMAMSYGATFISTSAIVGFGGVAAMFGMSLLWLTFANIFVGIFIAFMFLGGTDAADGTSTGCPYVSRIAGPPLRQQIHPGLRRPDHLSVHAAVCGGRADRRHRISRHRVQFQLHRGAAGLRSG